MQVQPPVNPDMWKWIENEPAVKFGLAILTAIIILLLGYVWVKAFILNSFKPVKKVETPVQKVDSVATSPKVVLDDGQLRLVKKYTESEAVAERKTGGDFLLYPNAKDLSESWSCYSFIVVEKSGNPIGWISLSTTLGEAKQKIIDAIKEQRLPRGSGIDRQFDFTFIFKNKGNENAKKVIIESWSTSGRKSHKLSIPTDLDAGLAYSFRHPVMIPMNTKLPNLIEVYFTVKYNNISEDQFIRKFKCIWMKETGDISVISL